MSQQTLFNSAFLSVTIIVCPMLSMARI